MKFFRLIELEEKPYTAFKQVAKNKEELKALKLDKDPLVVEESNLPVFKYGVCVKTVLDGKIVATSKAVLEEGKNEYKEAEKTHRKQQVDRDTSASIENGFVFDGNTFSLSKSAQLNWLLIFGLYQEQQVENTEISTKDGGTYNLSKLKIAPFIQEMFKTINLALSEGRTQREAIK